MLKYCALLSLCAGVGLAGDFVTGQAARLVIGQPAFTTQTPGASDTLLGAAGGIAFAGDTLFVADSNRAGLTPSNNRVLLYQNVSQMMPAPRAPIPVNRGRCPVCGGRATTVLGQPDFVSTNFHISATGMRVATGVASDGRILAVADTENNRVLIWNSIPTVNGQPADLVLGQPDFNTVQQPIVVTASAFRGPQGVWIQNGKLFVADTQNNRILIWNSIPTKNNQPADIVLGQTDFTTVAPVPVAQSAIVPTASSMLAPTSVTSDGVHVFVSDLGDSRVLIWNSIPTQNNQPADVEAGQKDFQSAVPEDTTRMCPQAGTDSNGNPLYPAMCSKTLNFPRFALSDGRRLFVADGGNDRVLIFNSIPTENAAGADIVLGQPNQFASVVTSMTDFFHSMPINQSAVDIDPTPTSLAWDGTNLYVADPSNRRILVYTPGDLELSINSVRNAASQETFATGEIDITGVIQAGDTVTITIAGKDYTYKVVPTDTIATILQNMVNLIDSPGDPNVIAVVVPDFNQVKLTSRAPSTAGNSISYSASTSANAQISTSTAGAKLTGGEAASVIAPGTVVTIFGSNLADSTAQADASGPLPSDLGGVQVYFDGIRAPLFFVSPGQINAQMPWEVFDGNSTSAYIRIVHSDGTVTVTNAVGVPITELNAEGGPGANPGIFSLGGADPRPAMAFHSSSSATGTITISGTIQANDIGTITIEDRSYNYTVQSTDTINAIRDSLIALINANPDERVTASAGATELSTTRILLRAKVPGPEGDNITVSTASSNVDSSTSAQLSLSLTNTKLCCANVAGAPITQANPAVPGETILVYATGLGLVDGPDGSVIIPDDGAPYSGPALNSPTSSVSSLADTLTANVISAGLEPGGIGIYKVLLELNPSAPPNPDAQLTISQDTYTSNIVTFPIGNTTFAAGQ